MEHVACLLLLLLPTERVVVDFVDLVELHHKYELDGNLAFDQVIWYEWNCRESRYEVVDWRILKDVRKPVTEAERAAWLRVANPKIDPPLVGRWVGGHATPVLDQRTGEYVSDWYDQRVHRRVVAKVFRETWLTRDPEMDARAVLPQERRRGLSGR